MLSRITDNWRAHDDDRKNVAAAAAAAAAERATE